MAIKINTKLFNIIRQVIKSTVFSISEMRNSETFASYLDTIKEPEAATWVRNNKVDFLRGLLEGFEIDNSQDAQLKDIHNNK